MLPTLFALPLTQKFVTAPTAGDVGSGGQTDPILIVVMLVALLVLIALLVGALLPLLRRRPPSRPRKVERAILIDGSNVIHWQDNTPQLEPLLQVVRDVSGRGLKPGVVFDANVGYKLTGRFLGERDLSRILSLPRDQIYVVPKGTQADPYLLDTARHLKAQIVTNDRFRDWVDSYPEVAEPGTLIRGGMRDGRVWLKGLPQTEGAL
jgi:hypothetical protein